MKAKAAEISNLISKHHKLRARSLNMIASENITSPSLREIMSSDFIHRYGEYEENDITRRWNEGNTYVVEVERIVERLARKLFGAKYVDLRPLVR